MKSQKTLIYRLAETYDRYRAERRAASAEEVAPQSKRHSRVGNFLRWLMPNGGTLLLVALLILTQNVWAGRIAAPSASSVTTIPYQGRLADVNGDPVTGRVNMEFRLYDVPTGGEALWTEYWTGSNAVNVSDGLFSVMLGSINPTLIETVQGHSQLYLEITVGTDDPMEPRVQLGSVPFSVWSLSVADNSITADKIASGAVGSDEIATDAVGSDEIATDAVGSDEIATDAVGSDEIAAGAVGTAEIATGAVGTTEIANASITAEKLADGAVQAVSIIRQNDTANNQGDRVIVTGWGYIQGDGSTHIEETVNFGVTFAETPIVLTTYLGGAATSTSPLLSDFANTALGSNGKLWVASPSHISKTGFTLVIGRNTEQFDSNFYYGYSWIAIGTPAN